jgi:hypothetical protein
VNLIVVPAEGAVERGKATAQPTRQFLMEIDARAERFLE